MKDIPPDRNANAPVWVDFALKLLVSSDRRENIAGDLLEEYRTVVLPERGAARARLWYVKQLFSFIAPFQFGLALGIFSAIAIVITNVFLPLTGIDIPDSDVVEWAIFGGVLALWALAGFQAFQRLGSFTGSLRAGAIVALVHIAMVMLTFAVINNIFLEIVSRQPEKIWALQHSGYPTMRAYLNHTAIRAAYLILPAFVVVGAICGTAGALVAMIKRRVRPLDL